MSEAYDENLIALSPSTAHTLISESPLHAWTFHRLLGGKRRKESDAAYKGKLFHAALLEDGAGIEVLDFDAFRSNEAKAARDLAIAKGRIPVVQTKWDTMQPAIERIKENAQRLGYSLDGGRSEVKLEWTTPSTDGQVVCHARLDWLSDDWQRIIDIKTTDGSVHPGNCAATIARDGGAIQEAAYRDAVTTLHPEVAGRESFVFLFLELKEPYEVVPIESDGMMRELGEIRWCRAVDLWHRCLSTDKWPGYAGVNGPVRVSPPNWIMAREMEEELT